MRTNPSDGRYTATLSVPSPSKSPAIARSPGCPTVKVRSASPAVLALRRLTVAVVRVVDTHRVDPVAVPVAHQRLRTSSAEREHRGVAGTGAEMPRGGGRIERSDAVRGVGRGSARCGSGEEGEGGIADGGGHGCGVESTVRRRLRWSREHDGEDYRHEEAGRKSSTECGAGSMGH